MSLVMCCFHGSWSYFVDLHCRATLKHGKSCLMGKFPRKLSKNHTFHFHTRPKASLHCLPCVLQIASYPAPPREPNHNGSSLVGPKAVSIAGSPKHTRAQQPLL